MEINRRINITVYTSEDNGCEYAVWRPTPYTRKTQQLAKFSDTIHTTVFEFRNERVRITVDKTGKRNKYVSSYEVDDVNTPCEIKVKRVADPYN